MYIGTCSYVAHDFDEVFDFNKEENMYLDIPTRQAALVLSPSVVSVVSSIGMYIYIFIYSFIRGCSYLLILKLL
jgi:hypothetical protein